MKVLLFTCLLGSLCIGAKAQNASTTCNPSPEVDRDLRRLAVGGGLPVEKSLEARKKILAELLQQYPDDLFVHLEARGTIYSTKDQVSLVDRYQQLFQKNPKSSQYKFLYARALVGRDTPRAMELLKEVEAADPTYAWPYLEFAEIHAGRKYVDLSQFRGELKKFFDLCPSSLDWSAWSLLVDRGTPEMSALYAHVLRERLMTGSDHYIQRYYWKLVWNLEFKAAPVSEHARLREQIGADLARLEGPPGAADGKWLAFLSAGYGIADDPGNVKRIEQQLLAKYPDSQEAKSILDERWWKEHPWPGDSPDEQNQSFYKALLEREDELLKTSPNDSMLLLLFRFTALEKLEGTTGEQLTTAAARLLEALPKDPIWQVFPPVHFQIAQVFSERRINPQRVPDLVEEGLRLERQHERRWDTHSELQGPRGTTRFLGCVSSATGQRCGTGVVKR